MTSTSEQTEYLVRLCSQKPRVCRHSISVTSIRPCRTGRGSGTSGPMAGYDPTDVQCLIKSELLSFRSRTTAPRYAYRMFDLRALQDPEFKTIVTIVCLWTSMHCKRLIRWSDSRTIREMMNTPRLLNSTYLWQFDSTSHSRPTTSLGRRMQKQTPCEGQSSSIDASSQACNIGMQATSRRSHTPSSQSHAHIHTTHLMTLEVNRNGHDMLYCYMLQAMYR